MRRPLTKVAHSTLDRAAIAADRTFILQISKPVIAERRCVQRHAWSGPRGQPPGAQCSANFEHEVPVQKGVIVLEDDVTGHAAIVAGFTPHRGAGRASG